MKINLRKAAVIQKDIKRYIDETAELEYVIEFDEFSAEIPKLFIAKNQKLIEAKVLIGQLWHIYFGIRDKVANLNNQAGIDHILAQIELQKKLLELESGFAKLKPAMGVEEINKRLDKIRTSTHTDNYRYSAPDTKVKTTCLSAGNIEDAGNQMSLIRQKIRNLNDDLLALNINTLLELTDAEYAVLHRIGVI